MTFGDECDSDDDAVYAQFICETTNFRIDDQITNNIPRAQAQSGYIAAPNLTRQIIPIYRRSAGPYVQCMKDISPRGSFPARIYKL